MKKGGFIKLGIGATILLFAFLYPTMMDGILFESVVGSDEEIVWALFIGLETLFIAGGVLLALGLKDFYRRKGLAFLMIPAFALGAPSCIYYWFINSMEENFGFFANLSGDYRELVEMEPFFIALIFLALGLMALSCALGFTGRKPEPVAEAPAPTPAVAPEATPTYAPTPVMATAAPEAAPTYAPTPVMATAAPAPVARYCEICGKEISEGFKFCEGCGAPIVAPMPEAASAPVSAPVEEAAGRLKSTFTSSGSGYASSGSTSAPSADRNFHAAGDL